MSQGAAVSSVGVVQANPEQSKHLATACFTVRLWAPSMCQLLFFFLSLLKCVCFVAFLPGNVVRELSRKRVFRMFILLA